VTDWAEYADEALVTLPSPRIPSSKPIPEPNSFTTEPTFAG